ncbi:MAG: alpha/beta fold hydrolase, partial [Archaeoglobaceae archaeon]
MKLKSFAVLVLLLAFVQPALATPCTNATPIIFVHGGAGSGAQFESQAMRFTSNGWPAECIFTFDYNSSMAGGPGTINPAFWSYVIPMLDDFINQTLQTTGSEKVELIGHSLGGAVVLEFLNSSNPLYKSHRATVIAHLVVLDSASALLTGTPAPQGIPTLAIWGWGDPSRNVSRAMNVYYSNL